MENPFEEAFIPLTSLVSGQGISVVPDIYCFPVQFANVVMVGHPLEEGWVLIDAGTPRSATSILTEAEYRFGKGVRPAAIILTHGHFDHVGAIVELVETWHAPVYAHPAELPYLTGQEDYPPADPSVGGGLVSRVSQWFPNESIDLKGHVHALPHDGIVPGLPDWIWIPTPGHTKGHISLYRPKDRVLIAGDAVTTVKQESVYAVFTQHKELHGPPAYFTTDWQAAWESVKRIADLELSALVTGHGLPMYEEDLRTALPALARHFSQEIPNHGRFVQ
ncbi:MBL fold metallo-hydrolase [Alicyclobacillus fastidiosus]|uniref:MBL fold metallo-hydrolase n=1 Tax=Alicyclobacillus fastidiosus TaxID=392011 RepID=A0ABV5AMV5_9BACL|nr:MBL fold metallo-hydrolase [Alicyclobacillus fastidiosus]WEH10191.1 MBL fold metallo-hydrolase [Alicyclobacillus fastidiosus]